MDPHKWPPVLMVSGKRCVLKVEAGQYDVVGIKKKSVDEVGPDQSFTLFYQPIGSSRYEWAGPVYWWSPSRKLGERAWIEPDPRYRISFVYVYYRESDDLYMYEEARRAKPRGNDQSGVPFELFTEYFDRNGSLASIGYARVAADRAETVAYYRYGKPITRTEFMAQANIPRP